MDTNGDRPEDKKSRLSFFLILLALAFPMAGNIQSRATADEAATNQTVSSAQSVAYCDLLEHSEKFKNQMIRVRGIYETDVEKSVIESPSCPTAIAVTWVTFDSHWESRTTRSVRKSVSELKWRVPLDVVFIGTFKTDGRFGHMDMYPLSLEVYKVEAAVTNLSSYQTKAQTDPSLSARIVEALRIKEPSWKYVACFDNTSRIVPSQTPIVCGVWQNPKPHGQALDVIVSSVQSVEEATKWLKPVHEHVVGGWHVSPYQIGDEGYLSRHKNGDRFEIEFRRGTVVASVEGDDLSMVREFAQCVFDTIHEREPG